VRGTLPVSACLARDVTTFPNQKRDEEVAAGRTLNSLTTVENARVREGYIR
jgi:hypothetical protein